MAICQEVISKVIQKKIEKSALMKSKLAICKQSPTACRQSHSVYPLRYAVRRGAPPCTEKYGEVRRSIGAAHNKLFTPYSSGNIRTHPYQAGVHPRARRKWFACIQSPDGLLTAECTRKFQPLFKSPVTAFRVFTMQLALPNKIPPSDISKKKK